MKKCHDEITITITITITKSDCVIALGYMAIIIGVLGCSWAIAHLYDKLEFWLFVVTVWLPLWGICTVQDAPKKELEKCQSKK